MSKTTPSMNAQGDGKVLPPRGGYREIGIPAVLAALRCQHMPVPEDERIAALAHDIILSDRLR